MPPRPPRSSRGRYRAFLASLRAARKKGKEPPAAPSKGAAPPRARDEKRPRSRSFLTLLGAFLPLLRPHALPLLVALLTLTVSTLTGLVMPAGPKFAVDYVLTESPGPSGIPSWLGLPDDRHALLWLLAAGMVLSALLSLVIDVTGRWQLVRVSKRLQTDFRRRLFFHAVRLPLWRVHALRSGGVASLLRNDGGAPADLLVGMLYSPWRAVVQLVGTLIILALVDWLLVVGALLLIPFIWLTHKTWVARIRPVWRGIRQTREDVDAHATEAFGGMRVVRAFAKERSEAQRFTLGAHLMARQEIFAWWWQRAVEASWRVLVPVASAAVLLYGGARVIEGTLSLGDVVLFVTYTAMLLGPLESLVGAAMSIQSGLAGLDRVLDLLEEEREFAKSEPKVALRPEEVRGHIEVEDVSFTYPGTERPVLSGVRLEARPGECVALVGPSGAGKTTLSNLVARFYDPDEGAVRIDGIDLRDIDVRSFRALLGVVEQDVFLFDGTVRENIAYARPDASQEEVERAARLAHAHDFISALDDGYDTVIGERGVKLSGGQKQRIALARAILKDPRILILDEATSNLDSESEALIQESLEALMRGRTTFVIAHRLSTVRRADRIVVLDEGRVVEQGTHEELLSSGGRYAEFLRAQLEERPKKRERASA